MFLSLLITIKNLIPPPEIALTLGVVLFALSWIRPRRIISLPRAGARTVLLAWVGIAGSLLVVVIATIVSAIAVASYAHPTSGFDGWWRRPVPLFIATVVVAIAALALRRMPLPAPGERAIAPRRPWHSFVSRMLLWISGIAAALLAVTALWQGAIGVSAPKGAQFLGNVPVPTDLPIFMTFNSGYGFVAGTGWPNYLPTLVVLAVAAVVFVVALRTDANRPLFARSWASSVRAERELTARVLTFILLGGLITTLGAVWMHAGSIGQGMIGLTDVRLNEGLDGSDPSAEPVLIGSGYYAIARPMNLIGHFLQAAGVAFLLRLAVDTARALVASRRVAADTSNREATSTGVRR
ncbi:hypothetical protein [Agreia bicolorata]|uniref:Uncharacterized protein n=1 Tax=Agreia bicolorata TaxID=110935 RepID=A0ABR5CH42_9MICO|nr:hypothetical protein [Agreia bicolorata]KJC64881.1 hypothetical protein TZ00_04295 [Agreia bicolorata]